MVERCWERCEEGERLSWARGEGVGVAVEQLPQAVWRSLRHAYRTWPDLLALDLLSTAIVLTPRRAHGWAGLILGVVTDAKANGAIIFVIYVVDAILLCVFQPFIDKIANYTAIYNAFFRFVQ
eukprot:3937150-Rhodomonas_salina.3